MTDELAERRRRRRLPSHINAIFKIEGKEGTIEKDGYVFDYSINEEDLPSDLQGLGVFITSEHKENITIYLSHKELQKLNSIIASNSKIKVQFKDKHKFKNTEYYGLIRHCRVECDNIRIGIEIKEK
jgi:hypothetical protein